MNRIKKTILSTIAAATILTGSTVVAPLVTAERSEAYSTSSCSYFYKQNIGSYTWTRYTQCYFDYTWWEESWLGGSHKDGWYSWPTPVGA